MGDGPCLPWSIPDRISEAALLRRNPINAVADDAQNVRATDPDTAKEPTGIERRRHPRVSLTETEAPPPARVGEERRRGDRRTADSSTYSGPERRRGDRRSFDEVRDGLHWGAVAEHKSKFQVPRNSIFKPARLILLAVALGAGGLAAALVSQSAPQQVAAAVVAEIAPVTGTKILVASQAIGIGEQLSERSIAWQDWPSASVRPEYITQDAKPEAIANMAGTMARFELFVGEPIREDKLAREAQGYLSAVLQTGMRGVSVSVSAQSAAGGFIVPNDHVDVVLTRPTITNQLSETILSNVRVLAINTRLGERGATGAPVDPDNPRAEIFADQAIATLELDQTQAEIIINAATGGSLALVLRSMSDFANPGDIAERNTNQAIRLSSPFWNNTN